ncbi:MAG: 50S ribosomal protein L9 [Candidatus Yanofskybacteria bacterium RIFCSPHIGHO2_02_FULL_44_12b]|uniref:Large ribosomal subunit protein bL9 n=2 Tax=Candidatus Yanofskyibacteriota TaxID=1752733 RepID=A0A1F8GMM2_9BACT|nr:MAG: 50S ribosomal protein L9 [Candidatus Yanofskybacteria bacterium GW2011_GWA2_44_9]OGN04180.1 MAG: 50S ribosomal protein L9 [Candidatus Yanofskybacteria bacterium RIFCSPHIGHO2_01_FULL_44_24]OGN14774.1 MAG: 50S ribosomal protein L9 [Candidatus Yanofskybacteria bacterium RIFCSPHIGHO2_02_FULL_44_12b]OGN25906.1 MAG: 50S ribosomal protein L9 [Candidatus Yanofskybacteria bacterium RIFCSPLOWO2_01_FULL_44_22]
MKIILLQNIKGYGQIGDVKNVSDGYGKNYLLPRKMAKLATDGALNEVSALKKKLEATLKMEKEKALEAVGRVRDLVLEFTKKASKAGKLYSSLTKEEVAQELSKAVGAKVEADSVDFKEHGEHIKKLGEHMIEVELAPEIKAEFKVSIKSE